MKKDHFYRFLPYGLVVLPTLSIILVVPMLLQGSYRTAIWLLMATLIINIFANLSAILALRKSLNRKINRILTTLSKLKEGDFSARTYLSNSGELDYIGHQLDQLANVFQRHNRKIKRLITLDYLTKVNNRATFMRKGKLILKQTVSEDSELALMFIDIDFFKAINDNFGHSVGDEVLKELAALCKDNLRRSDLFARYGGEEFVAMLPCTGYSASLAAAEKVRLKVASHQYRALPTYYQVTVSLGIALWDKDRFHNLNTLMERADEALYFSKENGRNCCTIYK
ncbi:MAG: diguanylate cyclase [Spirochaetaceae bacterium]|nr:diguanylate cyclase [Spirochaetaceae bacterium]